MAEETLARRMAAAVIAALKNDGHILVDRGGEGAVVRELDGLLSPLLPRLVARAARAPVSGEVTSTFGDEATDEAVEELVAEMREAIVENDHVEDVFAEDRELERAIFRALRDGLLDAARSDEAEEAARVPISVRLDTLGYVAATAARRADVAVVRAALERAARQADGELETFEPSSRVALFAMASEDPDHRLEVEEAVADELTSLVAEGAVDLPTVDRTLPVGRSLNPVEWRAARERVEGLVKRLTVATGVPASWRPAGDDSIRLSCTPLSEKDADLVDEIATVFRRDVTALLAVPSDEAPRSVRGGAKAADEAPRSARAGAKAADEAPRSARGGAKAGDEAPRSARAGAKAADEAPRSVRRVDGEPAAKVEPAAKGPAKKKVASRPPEAEPSEAPTPKRTSTARKTAAKKAPAPKAR